jgi:hypothetical protein
VLSCQFTLLHVVLPAGRRFAPAGWLEPMLAREPVSAPCRADAAASMIWTSRSASSTHQMGLTQMGLTASATIAAYRTVDQHLALPIIAASPSSSDQIS